MPTADFSTWKIQQIATTAIIAQRASRPTDLESSTMRLVIAVGLLLCAPAIQAEDPSPDVKRASNAEMTAIYDADQAARDQPAKIDWSVVGPADQARRQRTQTLLDAGKLNSGEDFYHAAYVFQHGDKPEDFLKAHALAVVALSRGYSKAAWIAAATLDRYLQNIGQPQIYGTQFQHKSGQPWTQEPYRRDVLSDAVRQATGVPPLAKQEDQRKEWARRMPE